MNKGLIFYEVAYITNNSFKSYKIFFIGKKRILSKMVYKIQTFLLLISQKTSRQAIFIIGAIFHPQLWHN